MEKNPLLLESQAKENIWSFSQALLKLFSQLTDEEYLFLLAVQ